VDRAAAGGAPAAGLPGDIDRKRVLVRDGPSVGSSGISRAEEGNVDRVFFAGTAPVERRGADRSGPGIAGIQLGVQGKRGCPGRHGHQLGGAKGQEGAVDRRPTIEAVPDVTGGAVIRDGDIKNVVGQAETIGGDRQG